MKKSIALVLVIMAAFVAGRFSRDLPVEAQAGEGPGGSVCADLNDDGSIDLTDAVYLLNHLFLGGGNPVCSARDGRGLALLATEFSGCFDADGDEIPCGSPACPGQGVQQRGCPREGRFVDNGDGTVTDNCTRLMWQKDYADVDSDGQRNNDSLNWCDSLAYCENLIFAGHDDWRLPGVRELQSIVYYGLCDPIDPAFHGEIAASPWSATRDSCQGGIAWHVNSHGLTVEAPTVDRYLVRAVRTIQPGE